MALWISDLVIAGFRNKRKGEEACASSPFNVVLYVLLPYLKFNFAR
jgi:hypothetical protein